MKRPSLYTVLFVLVMAVLCLPMVQHVGGLFHIKSLEGYTAPLEPVKLSVKSYRDGSYQAYAQRYLQQHFGFRNVYIRSYNQLMYSCFRQSTNQNIVIGKDGELYLRQYTDVYTGKTLRKTYGMEEDARAAMRQHVEETCRIIDSLRRFGTDVIVLLAPSKPLIYPEFLPDSIQQAHCPFSIQEEYAKLYAQAGVEHINFVPVFRRLKQSSPYPVYTRFGTHWAYSTIPFVADTILQKIAAVKHYPMPHVVNVDSNFSYRYKGSDRELEGQLNLLFPLPHDRLPMPTYNLQEDSAFRKPNLLVVGDSYFAQLNNTGFIKAFNRVDYWKYNQEAISSVSERNGTVPYVNRYEIITRADVILLIFTDMHAYDYFFGFLKTVEKTLEEGPDHDSQTAIRGIAEVIKASPEWYENVCKQAEEKHISVEQCLWDNARWVYEHQYR